jgi:hypothetical protein
MTKVTLDILTSKDDILKALFQNKLCGSIIGITSNVLGPGTYFTTVIELIMRDNETLIELKGYDMSGYFFDRSKLTLEEIESVIPFNSSFTNPFLRDMEREVGHDNNRKFQVNE